MLFHELKSHLASASSRMEVLASEDSLASWGRRRGLSRELAGDGRSSTLRSLLVLRRATYMIPPIQDALENLAAAGWQVRSLRQPETRRSLEFIVVDREVALVGGGEHLSNRSVNRRVEDSQTIDSLVRLYRGLWHQAAERAGEVLLYENPVVTAAPIVANAIAAIPTPVWRGLLKSLSMDPRRLFDLTPRQFEELVAVLLRDQGFEVELTRFSKDGGKDLIVASPTKLGSFLYFVQCKHFGPGHRVGVKPVRELYGVVEHERATAGLVVTTSSFTRGARQFQMPVERRLSLHDYESLLGWLSNYGC